MKKTTKRWSILGGLFGAAVIVGGSTAIAVTQLNKSNSTSLNSQQTDAKDNNSSASTSNENTSGTTNSNQNVNSNNGNNASSDTTSTTTDNTNTSGGTTQNPSTNNVNKPSSNPTTSVSPSTQNPSTLESQIASYQAKVQKQIVENSTSISLQKVETKSSDDSKSTQYVLTIKQSDESKKYGIVKFDDGNDTKTVKVGEKVIVNVTVTDDEYALSDLKVFSGNNSSYLLGVTKEADNKYSFTLPNETIDGEPNPFYDATNNTSITVRAKFAPKKLNEWTYDFESKSYNINVTSDDWIFDDVVDTKYKMTAGRNDYNKDEDEIPGDGLIQYRIYLNGHDIKIKNMTVPTGAQLMFINGPGQYTSTSNNPTVSLSEDTYMYPPQEGEDGYVKDKFGQFTVKGAIGRWGSVEYKGRLQTYLEW